MRHASVLRQTVFLFTILALTSGAIPRLAPSPGLTVHVFLSTECPISQQYVRKLTDLYRRYEPLGIRFVAWFPLRTDSRRTIRQFQKEYMLSFTGKPDPDARLAHQLRVRVTPEVVVMQANGQIGYQGAIDDWYVALGKHQPEAKQHYLRAALDAVLAGQPVAIAKTNAVGCLVE